MTTPISFPNEYETYRSLIGDRTREETLRLSGSSLSEERTLVATTIERLVADGFYPEAGELERTYLVPAFSMPGMHAENVTRIADLIHGITRTRFVPEERGYVFEAQTSRSINGLIVLFHASPEPVSRSQYDPNRIRVEWVGKDPSNHSFARMSSRRFRKEFKRVDTAVRYALD